MARRLPAPPDPRRAPLGDAVAGRPQGWEGEGPGTGRVCLPRLLLCWRIVSFVVGFVVVAPYPLLLRSLARSQHSSNARYEKLD